MLRCPGVDETIAQCRGHDCTIAASIWRVWHAAARISMLSLLSRCGCLQDPTCLLWCGVSRLRIVSQRCTNGLIMSISARKQQTSPRTPCADAMAAVGDRWKLAQNVHKMAKIAWFQHLATRLKQRSAEVPWGG